jgi:hypothetical protein
MATVVDRLQAIKSSKGYGSGTPIDYVELLAALFEDGQIADDNAAVPLVNRLRTILGASSNGANGGLTHFAGFLAGWSDDGFRTAFKDRWPSSRNQCGHFLTAVHLGFDPMKGFAFANSQSSLGTFFGMTTSGVPATEGICCRMIVGHEQVGDDAWLAAIRQVKSPSDDEVRTFFNAVVKCKPDPIVDLPKAQSLLASITVGNDTGNSREDLHLSLYGYIFGTRIRAGDLQELAQGSQWIRGNLRSP